jgi:HAE1 family hydrophobic/amphiphilic exporter-1
MVPLSTLVSITPSQGPDYTTRFNLYRAAQIIGSAAPGYSSGQAQAALQDVARDTMPTGMGYDWADLSYQENKASGTAGIIFGLSLLVVFLILAALYESWSLPFSVLLSTPVAVLGALAGLMSRHFDNNVYAQIGLIMLVGLTAKNAILIVEFAREQMHQGKSVVDAALQGAKIRLRPILMTSFAFVFGCIPLWVATGAGSAARQILGTAVVSGMLAATLLGIFFIPALFVIVERLATRRKKPADAEAVPTPPVAPAHAPAE